MWINIKGWRLNLDNVVAYRLGDKRIRSLTVYGAGDAQPFAIFFDSDEEAKAAIRDIDRKLGE